MGDGLDDLHDLFIRLVRIPSPSGAEREVADVVIDFVRDLGLEVLEDDSAPFTGLGCGNLIVRVPGSGTGERIALCAHLDTVPLEGPPMVVVEGGVVRSDGDTILGADDKAAVAVLLYLLRDLAETPPPADVEVVLTPGEEIGLQGAKALDLGLLRAEAAFVLDSEGDPGTVIVSAPTLRTVEAAFTGTAAHAGIEPEKGRSAVVAAARAIASMRLGRLDDQSTANVGIVSGGSAVNVVPEHCHLHAEVRSHDGERLAAALEDMLEALSVAAAETGVDVSVNVREDFTGYAHAEGSAVLRLAAAAVAEAGLEFRPVAGGGGSDANAFNLRGLPAATLGVGFENVHSPSEQMRLSRLDQLYRVAWGLVRAAGTAV